MVGQFEATNSWPEFYNDFISGYLWYFRLDSANHSKFLFIAVTPKPLLGFAVPSKEFMPPL